MISETLFVWIYLPENDIPVVAGRLDLQKTASGVVGKFVYGKSYLSRRDNIPIDPVSLRINEAPKEFVSLSGFPGTILDSCPDKWGIRVINRLSGEKSLTGYLLMNDPGRSGALAFSTSSDQPPCEMKSREFTLLELMNAAKAVESGDQVDPELLKALHPGTGGARPKCNIVKDGCIWIAKFQSVNDSPVISIPRLEHATMKLGELCGIRPAETEIHNIEGNDICLVKRFDREIRNGKTFRKAFLSARTVFYADPSYPNVITGSYGRLSRWILRFGCTQEHQHELYRRMVFNVAIRNSDDHELNHGLIHASKYNFEPSPAYDVVPMLVPNLIHQHALLIGDSAVGTIENLLSNAEAFGLNRNDAYEIINDIELTVKDNWQDIFYESGFGDEEIRRMEHIFASIPIRQEVDGYRP